MADSLSPGQPTQGLQYLAPSGMQVESPTAGINDPVSASTGAPVQTAGQMYSGSDKNTPPGPPVFKLNKYDFMWQAYWGTGGFYDGTILRKMFTEIDDQYFFRRCVAYYRNFLRHIIDATYKPVFSDGVQRVTKVAETPDVNGTLAPLWNAFQENVDNRHRSIGNFTKRAIKNARILEVCFVVVDNFPSIPEGLTVADAVKHRIFPYLYIRYPQQVEESLVQYDDFCKLNQIGFKEADETVPDPKNPGRSLQEPRWKIWTSDYCVKMRKNEKNNTLEEIPESKVVYNLGEVPVIPVMSSETEDGTVLPHPSFYTIARCNWAVYNTDSAQMRAVTAQMYPILTMPLPRGPEASALQAMNPMQGIYIPPEENGVRPAPISYLEYPTKDFEATSQYIEGLVEDLFRQAGQLGVQVRSKAAQSGQSKSYDFHAMKFVLKETAKMAKCLEKEIARIFQLWVTSEAFDFEVLYEEDYEPDLDPLDDVKLYTSYLDLNPGPKGKALAMEALTLSVFDDMDEDRVSEVIEEIKDNATDEAKNKDEIPPPGEEPLPDATLNQYIQEAQAVIDRTPQKKITKLPKRGFTLRK